MILNLISLSTVKTQLGIASGTTTYDSALTALIPIVSNDIRRILNDNFDKYLTCVFTTSDATISFASNTLTYQDPFYYKTLDCFQLGQVLYSPDLPSDTYLQSFNPLTGLFTLSATPTGSGTYVYPTLKISQWSAVSKMIWYRYTKMNTTDSISKNVQSESYGPVSITYANNEINKQYDYPQALLNDLGIPYAKVG